MPRGSTTPLLAAGLLTEAYGTGMGKSMNAYEGVEEKPTIETTPNAFKIILPNINAKYEMIELLEVSTSTVSRVIRKMVKNNLLK